MTLVIQCTVKNKEPLRMPGVTRNYCEDSDTEVVIELPENIFSLEKNTKTEINIGIDKEQCINDYDFCGVGYVVSKTKIETGEETISRAVISIGGLLLIVKTKNDELLKDINVVEKYYIGIKKLSK
ncbi:DNA-directed RNA polymerase subunit G [Desulfurococcaceae archaeon MEX13E-LK6-19]|nr:DNA-directed RNA polymerase subunit G [Desulfurococcaceae archaeon MEX13E-LK6-19]